MLLLCFLRRPQAGFGALLHPESAAASTAWSSVSLFQIQLRESSRARDGTTAETGPVKALPPFRDPGSGDRRGRSPGGAAPAGAAPRAGQAWALSGRLAGAGRGPISTDVSGDQRLADAAQESFLVSLPRSTSRDVSSAAEALSVWRVPERPALPPEQDAGCATGDGRHGHGWTRRGASRRKPWRRGSHRRRCRLAGARGTGASRRRGCAEELRVGTAAGGREAAGGRAWPNRSGAVG